MFQQTYIKILRKYSWTSFGWFVFIEKYESRKKLDSSERRVDRSRRRGTRPRPSARNEKEEFFFRKAKNTKIFSTTSVRKERQRGRVLGHPYPSFAPCCCPFSETSEKMIRFSPYTVQREKRAVAVVDGQAACKGGVVEQLIPVYNALRQVDVVQHNLSDTHKHFLFHATVITPYCYLK